VIHLGLIGYPLGHSLSPIIHNAALYLCELEGDYSLFSINPDNQVALKALLARGCKGEIIGLNVTIPYKRKVIPLLDELSPTVQAIDAVNTIFMKNGILIGDNTDVPGFLFDLHKILAANQPTHGVTKNALVLGAGGSARAIAYALVNDGWNVAIASRRPEQILELIEHLSIFGSQLSRIDFHRSAIQSLLTSLHLIVNTTPVGMAPNIHESPWPTGLSFPKRAIVYDLVYNPRETKLVQDAREAGLQAISGLGMLVEQAALSFELWTGCNVPREPLFSVVEAA